MRPPTTAEHDALAAVADSRPTNRDIWAQRRHALRAEYLAAQIDPGTLSPPTDLLAELTALHQAGGRMRPHTVDDLTTLAATRHPTALRLCTAGLLPSIAASIGKRYDADIKGKMDPREAWVNAQFMASLIACRHRDEMAYANDELLRDYIDTATIRRVNFRLTQAGRAGATPAAAKSHQQAVERFKAADRAVTKQRVDRAIREHAIKRRQAVARIEAVLLAGRVVGHDAGQPYASDFLTQFQRGRIESGQRFAARAHLIDPATGQESQLAKIPTPEETQTRRLAEAAAMAKGLRQFFEARGRVAVFVTLTAPPRFHSNPSKGRNSYDCEMTPDQAHAWIFDRWRAYGRAVSRQLGYTPGGIRVAEVHQDGCTHWHILLWIDPTDREALGRLLINALCHHDTDYIDPADHDALGRRVKIMDEDPARGSLVSYCYKYLQKTTAGLGDSSIRVQATRGANRIRAIQPIGSEIRGAMTLWRELRRVEEQSEEHKALIKHRSCANLARQAAVAGDFGTFLEYHVAKSRGQTLDPLTAAQEPESLIGLRPVYQRTATGNKRLIGLSGHGIFVRTRRPVPFRIEYGQEPTTNRRAESISPAAAVSHNDHNDPRNPPPEVAHAPAATESTVEWDFLAGLRLNSPPDWQEFSPYNRPLAP